MALNEWITSSDAVHAVHLSLGCNHDAAGQILLAFTKGANVDVLFTGYYVEDLEEGEDEYAPKLTGSLSPEDWNAFFISNLASCDFDWLKNRLTFQLSRITKEGETILSKITRYDDVRFSRSSLKHLLLDEKQRRGPKFGDFWPLLAEEVAVYIHEEGAPDQVGVAKGRAANQIADALASRGVSVSTTLVEGLLRAIGKRLLHQDRPSAEGRRSDH